ncbi:Argininosuccinate lyase, partial [Clarias magur]
MIGSNTGPLSGLLCPTPTDRVLAAAGAPYRRAQAAARDLIIIWMTVGIFLLDGFLNSDVQFRET